MSHIVRKMNYQEPPFCRKEILRYAGCGDREVQTEALMESCIKEIREKLNYEVCFMELPVMLHDNRCDFGVFCVNSRELSKNLQGCDKVILFAATIGVEIDRVIAKYGRIAPAKALIFQAIGAERIESLCDAFCKELSKEYDCVLKTRFSPGYGDVPLEVQKEIVSVLQCHKQIGLFLNDSLLMTPAKSVTAFVGITKDKTKILINKCSLCDKKDCEFRGAS